MFHVDVRDESQFGSVVIQFDGSSVDLVERSIVAQEIFSMFDESSSLLRIDRRRDLGAKRSRIRCFSALNVAEVEQNLPTDRRVFAFGRRRKKLFVEGNEGETLDRHENLLDASTSWGIIDLV